MKLTVKYTLTLLLSMLLVGNLAAQGNSKKEIKETGKPTDRSGGTTTGKPTQLGKPSTATDGKPAVVGVSTHSDPQDGKHGSKSDIKDPKNNGNQGSKEKGNQGSKEKGDKGSGGSGSHDANDAHGSKPDKVKENNGQGNAYGKDKIVDGRDFGQQRAEEARSKNKVITETAETVIAAEEVHVVSAKDQIKAVKTQVEVMKADPKADKTIIAAKEALIKQVEEKAALLEQQVKASKEAIARAKALVTVAPKAN